ncbi:L-histidine N(alpha)-methyltransferase [Thiohalophilus thiocyanatoxydans]|uniref:Dimethylhistidine N-methyltransferase n=1 Tax=Thiohalophilus thiocyanatoxydans TaxID=381308 RepID=A0A4V3H4D7_9GAMM|nr:L-histidine N(alpha)-methyltransferase [Thiohalophilus thiocyanatoxydans]TDY02765.1 dimethylhistidine N-methyltransferase [Thiohalophilus thiocyanatoxydans]
MSGIPQTRIRFYDEHPLMADFFGEVLSGLQQRPRCISPKFFYDERGSELFDAICRTEEYYPTRTEQQLLQTHAAEIAELIGEQCLLIEPGSGNSDKVRLLLDQLQPAAYLPMDISRDFLFQAAEQVANDYPWLDVYAACVDFTAPLNLPWCPDDGRRLIFFPGSSIGNFDPGQAEVFLRNLHNVAGDQGSLLIGVDMKKDPAILNAAYNDSEGVTAAFNLNLLHRIQRELNAELDPALFRHHAFYNEDQGRVEMHLISQRAQTLKIGDQQFHFDKDESIHTESSYKYTVEEFTDLAGRAGFTSRQVWTDPDQLFSLHYFDVRD